MVIKQINSFLNNSYFAKQVLREISILRQLSSMHNNIHTTKLIDIFISDHFSDTQDQIFLVLDYAPKDLKKFLAELGGPNKFTHDMMVKVLYTALCAMNFIHSANVIHRDIKPANLLITQDYQIKICDFGLSRTDPQPLLAYSSPKTRGDKSKIHDML